MSRNSLCEIASLILAAASVGLTQSAPTVAVASGSLVGSRTGPASAAFLGIPYAAPPVGPLRWKPPQPAAKWGARRDATQFGSPCAQLPARWFHYTPGREDCLYLNVWTPQLSAAAKLPVLVYFHGGSNTQGYSQMDHIGPSLSRHGLIVVSANYRLGPFGFLAHSTLSAESPHHSSGNYGLLDQLQVLKWVGENIAHFGGDPTHVTVMGQSAGAFDACLLMASPLATGLFQAAILQSGECQSVLNKDLRTPIPFNLISGTGEGSGERLAHDLQITGPDTLQKLRATPADQILQAWSHDPELHFDAIVDGWVVPAQPAQIFADGRQLPIPVLVGSNADEATVFGHNDVTTMAQYKDYLRRDSGNFYDEEFRVYPVASDADVPARYLQLQSDTFAYAAYSLAQAVTRSGQRAYLYYFTYADTGKRAALGAHHGEELFFLGENFPVSWEPNKEDQSFGETLRTYWTQFAKTGNPNGAAPVKTRLAASPPRWPAYAASKKESFELGRRIGPRPIDDHIQRLEEIEQRVETEALHPDLRRTTRPATEKGAASNAAVN